MRKSNVQGPKSKVQSPKSKVQSPESRVQSHNCKTPVVQSTTFSLRSWECTEAEAYELLESCGHWTFDIGLWTVARNQKGNPGHWVAFWFAAIGGGVGGPPAVAWEDKVRIKSGARKRTLSVRHKQSDSASTADSCVALSFTCRRVGINRSHRSHQSQHDYHRQQRDSF